VVLIHNDVDVPFAREGSQPAYIAQAKAVFKRHPKATIVWAHTGMGRVVRPINKHAANVEEILRDPEFSHVYFDISWDEVAKYIVANPKALEIAANLMKRYPDRFLFGTDEVAPVDQSQYLKAHTSTSRCGARWIREQVERSGWATTNASSTKDAGVFASGKRKIS